MNSAMQPLLDIPLETTLNPGSNVEHWAFDLSMVTDAPLVFFRRKGWLRWEATLWESERVETVQATYTFARLRKVAYAMTRWGAARELSRD